MRFIAILLLASIVFLSSFGGVAKPARMAMDDCCKNTPAKTACHKAPAEKQKPAGDCTQPGCTMLFSCQLCGFIVLNALKLSGVQSVTLQKPVTTYIIGPAAGFDADNWKPPRDC